MLIIELFLLWAFAVCLSAAIVGTLQCKTPWLVMLLLDLPILIPLFFISKRAFTWYMLELGVPRRDIVIDGELYLRRFFLSPRSWRYKLFLHDIRKGDTNRDPHNHPWPFRTLTLAVGYMETIFYPGTRKGQRLRLTKFGSYAHHKAGHVHQLAMYPAAKKATWTLVLAGPGEQSWGFWEMHMWDPSQDRFVDHKEYLGLGEEQDHVEDRIQVQR